MIAPGTPGIRTTRRMILGRVAAVALICANWLGIASAEDRTDPSNLMTPQAKSELDACVARAAQSAGDGQRRTVAVGVFIGSKGRPVDLAILESSGLEHLDKRVMRCLFETNYVPATRGEPIQWIFRAVLGPKRTEPAVGGKRSAVV